MAEPAESPSILDNRREEAGDRFDALAALYDSTTVGHLDTIGVGVGVGDGSGSCSSTYRSDWRRSSGWSRPSAPGVGCSSRTATGWCRCTRPSIPGPTTTTSATGSGKAPCASWRGGASTSPSRGNCPDSSRKPASSTSPGTGSSRSPKWCGSLERANVLQLQDMLLEGEVVTKEELEHFLERLDDPEFVLAGPLLMSAWGRRPD